MHTTKNIFSLIVVAGDECRERHFREVLVDSLCLADVRDADGRRRKMAEVRAIGGTAQHTEVCPFEEAEREDFFHGEVTRELAEEILKLAVR